MNIELDSRKKYILATLALIVAGVLGGFVPIAIKIVLHELPQFTYLFLRLTIMVFFLLPFSWKQMGNIFPYWKIALPLGILWIGYFLLFITGLPSTTAFMSSIGYAVYLMGTKRFIKNQSPIVITTSNVIIAWVITGISMMILDGTNGIVMLSHISLNAWTALIFMGVGAGVIMWFLINWGLKYGSAIAAGSMTYLNILTAGVFGALLLGEKVTQQSLIGGALLIIGIFFSSLFPLINNNHTKQVHR